jgi:type 1 fimbriae regulatory protein FimB
MIRAFSKDELQSLLKVAAKHSSHDELMLLVAFNHGLRVSEVINLDSSNVQGDTLVVQRLKGSELTAQPLLPSEKARILEMCSKPGKFFPMCRTTVWRRMKAYCDEAGIPMYKARPHALKHTCGTLGHEGGMTIPELQTYLGHKSGSNTLIYLKVDDDKASKAFATAVGK